MDAVYSLPQMRILLCSITPGYTLTICGFRGRRKTRLPLWKGVSCVGEQCQWNSNGTANVIHRKLLE